MEASERDLMRARALALPQPSDEGIPCAVSEMKQHQTISRLQNVSPVKHIPSQQSFKRPNVAVMICQIASFWQPAALYSAFRKKRTRMTLARNSFPLEHAARFRWRPRYRRAPNKKP